MSGYGEADPDRAAALADAERDELVRRARARPVIEGVSGDCEMCGEPRPRLVGGLCAFCRDGRAVSMEGAP